METLGFFFNLITFSTIFAAFIVALNIKLRTKDRLVSLYFYLLVMFCYHTFYPLVIAYVGSQRVFGIVWLDYIIGVVMLVSTYGLFFIVYLLVLYLSGIKEKRLFSSIIFGLSLVPFSVDMFGFTCRIFQLDCEFPWLKIVISVGFWLFFLIPPIFLVIVYRRIPPGHLKRTTRDLAIVMFCLLLVKIVGQLVGLGSNQVVETLLRNLRLDNFIYIALSFIITQYMVRYYFHKYDQLIDNKMLDAFCLQQHISEREREILFLVAEGLSNKEIAFELKITESTVKKHLQNIMKKSSTTSRLQLISEVRKF
ncbi:MAG: hypothetical protein JXR63_03090 [Spirochaetales bacterium]|nr:hypothetical protein [Spirochaetales bacterium]